MDFVRTVLDFAGDGLDDSAKLPILPFRAAVVSKILSRLVLDEFRTRLTIFRYRNIFDGSIRTLSVATRL